MEIQKELSDISLQITEPEYRAMPELSYSILSNYMTLGFSGLDHLFDKKESLSLTLGSAVDAIITGGEDEFNSLFAVADISSMGDTKENKIVHYLFDNYGKVYSTIEEVPATYILEACNQFNYGADNWKPETKTGKITKAGTAYWKAKVAVGDKTLLSLQNYQDVRNMVKALRESPATGGFFAKDDWLSPIRRYYQLKFKATLDNVGYRCMADEIIVDYEHKIVQPIDLKTSLGCDEWNFEENFKKWHYYIQARLYWRIIRANMNADPYFKDFELNDYIFIIVNPKNLMPLKWKFPLTQVEGTLITDDGEEIVDPFVLGKELRAYLNLRPPVPNEINKDGVNIIKCIKIKE